MLSVYKYHTSFFPQHISQRSAERCTCSGIFSLLDRSATGHDSSFANTRRGRLLFVTAASLKVQTLSRNRTWKPTHYRNNWVEELNVVLHLNPVMTCDLRLFYSDTSFMNTIQRASHWSAATRKYVYMKLIYVCVKPLSFRNAVSCWGCLYSFSSWRREHSLMWCLRRRPSGESSYQHADHPAIYFPLLVFLPGVTLLPYFSPINDQLFLFLFFLPF